jgi:hypothetical protein
MNFNFETDDESQKFCNAIAEKMSSLFGISIDEAVGRVNREWEGNSIIGDDIIYHETEEYWANNIFYGKDSDWWLSRKNLKPRSYP